MLSGLRLDGMRRVMPESVELFVEAAEE